MPKREDYALLSDEEYQSIVTQRLRAELAALLQSEIEAELIEASAAELEARGQREEAEARRRHVAERRALIQALRNKVQTALQDIERGRQGMGGPKAPQGQ